MYNIGNEHTEDIRKIADKFMKQGIKMKDATHLACAIKADCDYFLTTDDKLIEKYNENAIKIRTPSLLQNSVSFAQAPAFSRLKAAKHAFFKGCCCKNGSFATASTDNIFERFGGGNKCVVPQ